MSGEPPDEDFFRRMGPPENEVPVAIPVNVVLARTDDAAIALTGMQVYSTGVAFDVAVRVRTWPDDDHGGLGELVFEHGRRGSRLLIGVELSDGRRASNVGGHGHGHGHGHGPGHGPGFGADPSGIVFHQSGGGGGQLAVDQSWWLSPVPPEGPVRFVCSCAELNLAETSVELDGTAMQRAAERVVTLWPWVRPGADERLEPPPPDLPDDSWFAGPA
jgi:hypothetical protein